MASALPEFLVVERFERLDGRDVGRQGRCGTEDVAYLAGVAGHQAAACVDRAAQDDQTQQAPEDVAADFAVAEGQRALGFDVVDRVRRGVDLKGSHLQPQGVGGIERVGDVLVQIEHLCASQAEVALLERRQRVAFAQAQVTSVAPEGVHRMRFDDLQSALRRRVEGGKFHDLHQITIDVDHHVEAVADSDAVGFDAGGDRRRCGVQNGRQPRQKSCRQSCFYSFRDGCPTGFRTTRRPQADGHRFRRRCLRGILPLCGGGRVNTAVACERRAG